MSDNLMTIPLCQLKRAALNAQDRPQSRYRATGREHRSARPMDYPVPCRVLGEIEVATYVEISLAENIVRSPLHPADQFDAFAKLQKEGLAAEEIAARFGLPAKVVIQRLKLGAVTPRLMAAYRADELTLDQLMAFAITDDHAAQEAFWFDTPHGHRSPQAIRRHLTSALVEGGDRRALFIGAKAYETAGGTVIRDLFQPNPKATSRTASFSTASWPRNSTPKPGSSGTKAGPGSR